MNNNLLKYDYNFMSAAKVGEFGFKKEELAALAKKLPVINAKLQKLANEPELSFRKLPYDLATADLVQKTVKDLQSKFDTLVLVGIGGSDLGGRAINNALGFKSAKKVYFSGDTTDPQALQAILAKIDLARTLFYVVSKSGETVETMVAFLYLRQEVIKKVGLKNHRQHFLITTNTQKGKLLAIAQKEDYAILPHYSGGGRFSALSVNGLVPAAWLGLDLRQLLKGGQAIEEMAKNSWQKNLAFIYAALIYLGYKKGKQRIAVLMPYAEALNNFSFWYRQLLAESLNKKYDLKGNLVQIGLTPVAAAGPKDQHSQLQLYNEGANDKTFTFIRLEHFDHDLKVPLYQGVGLEFLAGQSLGQILNIEQQAVAWSLMKNKRASGAIILPQLDEYNLGQLFQFFELAVVYLGELLAINVFDQPGVEDSKKQMMKMLKVK